MKNVNWEKALKDTAILSVGALVGGYAEKWVVSMLKNKLFVLVAGFFVVLIGVYLETEHNELIGDFIIGLGLPWVALYL